MARVHHVMKARQSKNQRRCFACFRDINPGDAYKYFEPYSGPPKTYHEECTIPRSHTTTSKIGQVWGAQDEASFDGCSSVEDVRSVLSDVAQIARDVAEEYQESLEAMPEGTQEGQVGQDMQEKIDVLGEYADNLESWEPDCDETNEDEVVEQAQEAINELNL